MASCYLRWSLSIYVGTHFDFLLQEQKQVKEKRSTNMWYCFTINHRAPISSIFMDFQCKSKISSKKITWQKDVYIVYEYYYLNSKQPFFFFFFHQWKLVAQNINGITVYKHIMADGNQRFERVDWHSYSQNSLPKPPPPPQKKRSSFMDKWHSKWSHVGQNWLSTDTNIY